MMTAPETKWDKFIGRECSGDSGCGHCEGCRNVLPYLFTLTSLERPGTEEYFNYVHGEAMRAVAKLGYHTPKLGRGKAPRAKRSDSPSPQCCDYCGVWQGPGVRVFAHEHIPVVACLSCVEKSRGLVRLGKTREELPPNDCPCGVKWCKARWLATKIKE